MLRFLLWRLLGLFALLLGAALAAWCLDGGLGRSLRGRSTSVSAEDLLGACWGALRHAWGRDIAAVFLPLIAACVLLLALVVGARLLARRRRRYVRLRIDPHRTDSASAEAVVKMFERVQFLDGPGDGRAQGASSEPDGGADDADGREPAGAEAEKFEVTF